MGAASAGCCQTHRCETRVPCASCEKGQGCGVREDGELPRLVAEVGNSDASLDEIVVTLARQLENPEGPGDGQCPDSPRLHRWDKADKVSFAPEHESHVIKSGRKSSSSSMSVASSITSDVAEEGTPESQPGSLAAARLRALSSQATCCSDDCHPFARDTDLMDCIRLVRWSKFRRMTAPLPRCQDLPASYFGVPRVGDVVIAVSHAWRNQAHPDPCGRKLEAIKEMVRRLDLQSGTQARAFIFVDFASINQRPFLVGQEDRSEEEDALFKQALGCMHRVYLAADRIIHLDGFSEVIKGEESDYTVHGRDLQATKFAQVGDWVQIVGKADHAQANRLGSTWSRISLRGRVSGESTERPHGTLDGRASRVSGLRRPSVAMHGHRASFSSRITSFGSPWGATSSESAPFDRVVSVDGVPVTSARQMEAKLLDANFAAQTVQLRRFPFGRVNTIPADERGWVFLERFITMVKCAMLSPEESRDIVLSNTDAISEQIERGSDRLRVAARSDGQDSLVKKSSCPSISASMLSRTTAISRRSDQEAYSISPHVSSLSLCGSDCQLSGVLNEFLDELARKRFMAASTDKCIIDGGSRPSTVARLSSRSSFQSDRSFRSERSMRTSHSEDVLTCNNSASSQEKVSSDTRGASRTIHPDQLCVSNIMAGFVDHLQEYWHMEAARQRKHFRVIPLAQAFDCRDWVATVRKLGCRLAGCCRRRSDTALPS